MHAPQILFIVLLALAGGITLAKHGESKGNYNFFVWGVSMVLEVGILYWGGFFS